MFGLVREVRSSVLEDELDLLDFAQLGPLAQITCDVVTQLPGPCDVAGHSAAVVARCCCRVARASATGKQARDYSWAMTCYVIRTR